MGCGRSSQTAESSSCEDLETALKRGSVQALRQLLTSRSIDVNEADGTSGEMPLVLAARVGASPEAFKVLLDSGADPLRATSSDSRPLLSLLAEWDDKDNSRAVAEVLLQRGLDASGGTEATGKDGPLLAAVKAFNGPLAEVLIANGSRLDVTDADGNTPLHFAGSFADAVVVAAILAKGGGASVRNSAGFTPVMCARLGGLSPQIRLSPEWKWCRHEVLDKQALDAGDADRILQPGETVWRCSTGRCFSIQSMVCPSFPRNHEVAAAIALAAGDAYSLTDAIEGAWLDGEAPPEKPQSEVHPNIIQAIAQLVRLLQHELRRGLESKDAIRVEAGLEMLRYANVAKLPEEERAVKMLVRMKLEQALAGKQELELKQALLTASQYHQVDSPLFKSAQEALELIMEEKQVETLIMQLTEAMDRNDCNSLHAVLQYGKSGKLKTGSVVDRPEYARGVSFLEETVRKELVQATAKASRRLTNVACARARKFELTSLKEYKSIVEVKKGAAIEQLRDATKKQTEESPQAAPHMSSRDSQEALRKSMEEKLLSSLRSVLEDEDLSHCGIRHELAFKEAIQAYRDVLSLPFALEEEQVIKMVTQGKADVVRKSLKNDVLVAAFQDLFDMTNRQVRTKDRRIGGLPKRLVVKEVLVVQNADNLIKYVRRRESIRKQIGGTGAMFLSNLQSDQVCKTFCRLPDGRQFHKAWQEADDLTREVIDPTINEFYLFHGTSPTAATAITDEDFRLDLAGTNMGTMYGRGIYFAESVTKSDEYVKQDSRNLYPMLICRVTLGRIYYTAEEYPSTSTLTKHCTTGEYNSVLGDREKCRGTFREMIVYDAHQVYPEFVVWYAREYSPQRDT